MLPSSLFHSAARYLPVSSRQKASANREEPLPMLRGALLSFSRWRTLSSSARALSGASSIGVLPAYSDKWMHMYVHAKESGTLLHIIPLRACTTFSRTRSASYCWQDSTGHPMSFGWFQMDNIGSMIAPVGRHWLDSTDTVCTA